MTKVTVNFREKTYAIAIFADTLIKNKLKRNYTDRWMKHTTQIQCKRLCAFAFYSSLLVIIMPIMPAN